MNSKKKDPAATALMFSRLFFLMFLVSGSLANLAGQQIESVNGVRFVHNNKGVVWGVDPKITIDLLRTIGNVDTNDENLAFGSPLDMAVDDGGRIHILDSGNQRIQVFGTDGKYLRTIGRRGQGPGEFESLNSINFDSQGNFHVLDSAQRRIQVFTPRGEVFKTTPIIKLRIDRMRLLRSGLVVAQGTITFGMGGVEKEKARPGLVKLLGPDLEIVREFGEPFDYGDEMTNGTVFFFSTATAASSSTSTRSMKSNDL